jgi:hypothetical protein
VDDLKKLLEIVRRELGATDARAEIGGRDPSDAHSLWTSLPNGWRIVAVFDTPPPDPERKHARLATLIESFGQLATSVETPTGGLGPAKQHALDEELDVLAERAGARAAVVFDERSPVLWGCSVQRARGWDIEAMERARALANEAIAHGIDPVRWLAEGPPAADVLAKGGVDETVAQRWSHRFHRLSVLASEWRLQDWREALTIATSVAAARAECSGGRAPDRFSQHAESYGVFARGFAQIYLVALVYDGPFSELHAEGPLVRALPHIETLVLALPPVDPPPRAANVIRLPRR